MEAFWSQIALSLMQKSIFNCGRHGCTEWTGGREHGVYGKKSVVWPDGKKKIERVHRLSYMHAHHILRDEMPNKNSQGERLDVSHICHNPICLKPEHLILEPHSLNMDRMGCRMRNLCTKDHHPHCLL